MKFIFYYRKNMNLKIRFIHANLLGLILLIISILFFILYIDVKNHKIKKHVFEQFLFNVIRLS